MRWCVMSFMLAVLGCAGTTERERQMTLVDKQAAELARLEVTADLASEYLGTKDVLGTDLQTKQPARVHFDLVGTWNVLNFFKEGDKYQPTERFDATWRFDTAPDPLTHLWTDKNGQGTFELLGGSYKVKLKSQILWWKKEKTERVFIIREHSFGLLMMDDIKTGEHFMAHRTDGPQGEDARFIKYDDEQKSCAPSSQLRMRMPIYMHQTLGPDYWRSMDPPKLSWWERIRLQALTARLLSFEVPAFSFDEKGQKNDTLYGKLAVATRTKDGAPGYFLDTYGGQVLELRLTAEQQAAAARLVRQAVIVTGQMQQGVLVVTTLQQDQFKVETPKEKVVTYIGIMTEARLLQLHNLRSNTSKQVVNGREIKYQIDVEQFLFLTLKDAQGTEHIGRLSGGIVILPIKTIGKVTDEPLQIVSDSLWKLKLLGRKCGLEVVVNPNGTDTIKSITKYED